MKAELQGLQLGTKEIQKELLGILEKPKNDFLASKEEKKRELQKMRVEAKSMTQEIKQVLQDQKAIWQQETTVLKDSLVDARKEMDSAKADSVGILQSSRSALSDLKEE